ncbi:hypothetical protein [Kribbella sp. NPDC006257]|uniref:hypothetical protein n=1 Tax=Kribbella sp. NPDC006257 TaxID=3156738 RepID=UPI0033BD0129
MSGTVFPIGHYGGTRAGADGESVHAVRVGWQQYRLSEDAFTVWVLAHGTPEIGKGRLTVEDILLQAAEIPDAGTQLEELVTQGALTVVTDRPDEATAFAKQHRLDVLFVGLGNAPDRPDGHAVGVPGLGAAAVLDPDCYELWQWGSVAPTLWHSCEVRAAVTSDLGREQGPLDALGEILGDLRYLLAHGCAYLDLADVG